MRLNKNSSKIYYFFVPLSTFFFAEDMNNAMLHTCHFWLFAFMHNSYANCYVLAKSNLLSVIVVIINELDYGTTCDRFN